MFLTQSCIWIRFLSVPCCTPSCSKTILLLPLFSLSGMPLVLGTLNHSLPNIISTFVAEKKPILTPCWNCSYDLLLVAFVIVIIQNGLASGNPAPLPNCLKWLCSKPCPAVDSRKEEINIFPAGGLPFWEMFAKLVAFLLCFLTCPHLWSIKKIWHSAPIKWLLWGALLPFSQSASSPN